MTHPLAERILRIGKQVQAEDLETACAAIDGLEPGEAALAGFFLMWGVRNNLERDKLYAFLCDCASVSPEDF